MKLPCLVLLLCFLILSCENKKHDKSYFKVVEVNKTLSSKKYSGSYYRIILSESAPSDLEILNYTFDFKSLSEKDKINLIQELLHFEGDTRLSVIDIQCYNPHVSQIYRETERSYSIQVEALFIINMIYFSQPFEYAPYPVLIDKKSRDVQVVQGQIIEEAYKSYKNWFKEIRRMGFSKAIENNTKPLDNSKSRWYW